MKYVYVLLFLFLTSFSQAFLGEGSTIKIEDSSRQHPVFFKGKLSLYTAPRVGRETNMSLELTAAAGNCGAATIQFRAPAGIIFLSRDTFNELSFTKGTYRNYLTSIRIMKEGNYVLQATVYFQFPNGIRKAEHFYAYLVVGKKSSELPVSLTSLSQKNLEAYDRPEFPPSIPAVATGFLSLNGYIKYYNDNLLQEMPVKKVKVELFEYEGNAIQILASTYTGNDGYYSFESVRNTDNDDPWNIYLRIIFDNDVVSITDLSESVYKIDSQPIGVTGGRISKDFSLDVLSQQRALGFIFNCIVEANDVMQQKLNWRRDKIAVRWPSPGDQSGYGLSYWSDTGKVFNEHISIPLTDQWERKTILHEYGHSVMTALYGYNNNNLPDTSFTGGSHSMHTVSDTGFAMKEGWAEFFEAFADDDAFNTTSYINSNMPNIETNNWWSGTIEGIGSNTKGESVEGAVASILWDITDTANSRDETPNVDDDDLNGLYKEIWSLILNYKPVDILKFWNYWIEHNYAQTQSLYSIYSKNSVIVSLPNLITKNLQLYKGWNLISIPVQPLSNDLKTVLQPIAGHYNSVWTYETGWKKYEVNASSAANTLNTIVPGKGYWIDMLDEYIFAVSGNQLSESTVNLRRGWNLAGYKSLSSQTREKALSSISGKYQSVWAYDTQKNSWKKYIVGAPSTMNDLETADTGKGFWINANNDCIWNVSN